MSKRIGWWVMWVGLWGLLGGAAAQADPHAIQIPASDGLTLHGAYFAPHADAPAVLLLHQMYTNRHSWDEVTAAFLQAGYNVLAVDLRGYGETRGRINWGLAQDDTLRWAAWLSQQSGVRSVTMVGSSMGSSLALVGCAAFDPCRGVVAISPGLNYFGVSVADALADGMPILALYADRDRYPARAMPEMQDLAGDALTVEAIGGRAHGLDVLAAEPRLLERLVGWVAGL